MRKVTGKIRKVVNVGTRKAMLSIKKEAEEIGVQPSYLEEYYAKEELDVKYRSRK